MAPVRTVGRRAGLAIALCAAGFGLAAGPASAAKVGGTVESGKRSIDRAPVKLYSTGEAGGDTKLLGRDVSDRRGRFSIRYSSAADAILYLTVGRKSGIRLAATLGPAFDLDGRPRPRRVVVNERTTVATGYAFAQFIQGRRILGPEPGPQNASLMAANLANPRKGTPSKILKKSPNGPETTTLRGFNSVANMVTRCARSLQRCARLFRLAAKPDGRRPRGVLQAIANIADNPWQNVNRLFKLSTSKPSPYSNALKRKKRPSSWIMPVRFVGDGNSLDGPGNTAFDADGNAYVANNYRYGADPLVPRCGSDELPKFRPDGQYAENSPFKDGGLSGAGYGVTMDPSGDVWVGNYGFAAPVPQCPASRQPPHDSISQFNPDGSNVSPNGTGWTAPNGKIFWPQGTISDQAGENIWIANCGNGAVTRMPVGDPTSAVGFDVGLEEGFDVALNHDGYVFATGLGNSKLAILEPDGTPIPGSPFGPAAVGVDRPMGIAADSRGNMWIANSGLVDLPCPGPIEVDFSTRGGSLSLVESDATPVTSGGNVFEGGGLTIPWGIAVDGDDKVWVSNFAKQRVSHFCGMRTRHCPPGVETGQPISPDGTGYDFDGFVRLTSTQIDPAGNVWVANNWKLIPVQSNPGGYEMVILVGAAAPLKTPLIGPPVPLQ